MVAAGYDLMAARYAEWQTLIVGDPRDQYVERLLARLPAGPEILEIGSGGGVEPTPTFAKLGRLIGVDISQAQIERARATVPNAQFIHADILETTFDDESFDAAVALFVLTHILPPNSPASSTESPTGFDRAVCFSRRSAAPRLSTTRLKTVG
jgi:ubiquinone/menaquinone biosynthesis C-methylase UbiE